MNEKTSQEVLILGMHRSGTSMLSGMLDRLGVDMGDDQPGRQLSNPMGHYEDGDLLGLNESILAEAGGSWNNPPSLAVIQNQEALFEEKIRRIIHGKQQENKDQPWGWKDPRTSLTIRLYLPYLKNLYIIWCQRDPEAITSSLWKRNKIPRQESEDLTKHYQQQISDFVQGHPEIPVLKISYHDIVDEPEHWINEVVAFLDLEPDENQLARAVEFILPKEIIQREKKILWWKYVLSLPARVLRKMKIIK